MGAHGEHISIEEAQDPCGDFGSLQRWAVVWFVCVLVIGSFLVANLSRIDTWMYANNAEFLNFEAHKENRSSQTMIASDGIAPAAMGSLSAAEDTIPLGR